MDDIQLPIPPSKLQLKISNANQTITLIDMGEVNVLKSAGLSEISFDVMIPQQKYPFAVYTDGFKSASYFLKEFERRKLSKAPFRFIVTRLSPKGEFLFDTNMKVSLEEYTIDESVDNGLDLNISVRLKQYRDYGTQRVTPQKTTDGAAPSKTAVVLQKQRSAPAPAKTYVVKRGDTLWGICKKNLGDGSKYVKVAKANGIKNPNLIYPGQVIKLE
jgi:LysM repeat protein